MLCSLSQQSFHHFTHLNKHDKNTDDETQRNFKSISLGFFCFWIFFPHDYLQDCVRHDWNLYDWSSFLFGT